MKRLDIRDQIDPVYVLAVQAILFALVEDKPLTSDGAVVRRAMDYLPRHFKPRRPRKAEVAMAWKALRPLVDQYALSEAEAALD